MEGAGLSGMGQEFFGQRLLRVAHRGGAGLSPENTLSAFRNAATLAVDAIELDVHLTGDGRIVVIHDDTVDRTTNGSGAVRDMTLARLQDLDAGHNWTCDNGATFPFRGRGITIPTLAETLEAFDNMRFLIEIKPDNPAIAEPVIEVIREHNATNRTLVGSFATGVMKELRRKCPEQPTAAGESEVRRFYFLAALRLNALCRLDARALVVPEWNGRIHVVTPGTIAAAHRSGMAVYVWTVNERADMDRLVTWGADGVISDYPDRLMEMGYPLDSSRF